MSKEKEWSDKPETLRLMKHVLKVFTEKSDAFNKTEDAYSRASLLTGIHEKSLKLLENCTEQPVFDLDRFILYNEYVQFCLITHEFPTTYELYDRLQQKLPYHMDIGKFRKLLIRMDFVWKSIREDLTVVIERPEVTFEKYRFLRDIIECKQSNMPVYFVSECYIDQNDKMHQLLNIEDATNAVTRVIFAAFGKELACLEKIEYFNEIYFEDWILSKLLVKLTGNSVVVITDLPHHKGKYLDIPTLESLRVEIIAWLQKHDVPYDANMSKYELMCLVKQYTDANVNLYKIDKLLKFYGHTVLRLPKHIEMLTPVTQLIENILKDVGKARLFRQNVDVYIKNNLSLKISSELVAYEMNVFNEYRRMLKDDKTIDSNWDTIMKNSMKKNSYVDTYLPYFTAEESNDY